MAKRHLDQAGSPERNVQYLKMPHLWQDFFSIAALNWPIGPEIWYNVKYFRLLATKCPPNLLHIQWEMWLKNGFVPRTISVPRTVSTLYNPHASFGFIAGRVCCAYLVIDLRHAVSRQVWQEHKKPSSVLKGFYVSKVSEIYCSICLRYILKVWQDMLRYSIVTIKWSWRWSDTT